MTSDIDSVRNHRLQRTLQAVSAAHPFYRRRFAECGIAVAEIATVDDLVRLPTTAKNDYIADPDAFRLRADDLPADFAVEERVLWDVAYTTGTTSGRPSPFYNTTHDCYAILDQARRCNEAEGFLPDDRVANLYPMAGFPTGAFLSVVRIEFDERTPARPGAAGWTGAGLRAEVTRRVREAVSLRPEVEFEGRGVLYDQERSIKARRVVDSRKIVE